VFSTLGAAQDRVPRGRGRGRVSCLQGGDKNSLDGVVVGEADQELHSSVLGLNLCDKGSQSMPPEFAGSCGERTSCSTRSLCSGIWQIVARVLEDNSVPGLRGSSPFLDRQHMYQQKKYARRLPLYKRMMCLIRFQTCWTRAGPSTKASSSFGV
jgi:hypothetical protein